MNSLLRRTPSGRRKIIYKERIGEGSFGEVWMVEWGETKAAAKRIHKKFFQVDYDKEIIEERVEKFITECEILRNLDHDNIVKLLDVRLPENKSPVIIMELMHCDLEHYIKLSTSTPKVSPDKVVSIALDIAEGLKYLHGLPNPIIHRDLSSKNILLTENGQAKIADLGVAKILLENKDATASPKPGALLYAAPETYQKVRHFTATYGVPVDIFSFGVVLLEMNVGHKPRVAKPSGKTTQIIRRQADLNEIEDGDLKRMVIHCLQEKSKSRPSASKIVTDLQRIKKEREEQRERCTQTVNFERLRGKTLLFDHHFKVLLLGNCNVGKSSLFELLRNPTYDISEMKSTVAIKPEIHYFEYNAKTLKMEIVDTSGEERFFALTSNYYRDVDAVFLVYSVVDKASLQSLKFWRARLKKYNSRDNLQMLLVGNKMDLRQGSTDSTDLVPQERANNYASEIQCPYVETSARDIDSVMMMYRKMAEMLMSVASPDDVNVQVEEPRNTIRLSQPRNQDSSRTHSCFFCRNN